jgi:hypothetical protein
MNSEQLFEDRNKIGLLSRRADRRSMGHTGGGLVAVPHLDRAPMAALLGEVETSRVEW